MREKGKMATKTCRFFRNHVIRKITVWPPREHEVFGQNYPWSPESAGENTWRSRAFVELGNVPLRHLLSQMEKTDFSMDWKILRRKLANTTLRAKLRPPVRTQRNTPSTWGEALRSQGASVESWWQTCHLEPHDISYNVKTPGTERGWGTMPGSVRLQRPEV